MSETIEFAEFKRVEMKVGKVLEVASPRGRQTLYRPDRRGWRAAAADRHQSGALLQRRGADGSEVVVLTNPSLPECAASDPSACCCAPRPRTRARACCW